MLQLIAALLPIVGKVLDRVIPDLDARDRAKAELTSAVWEHAAEMERAAADVVIAEARGESAAQRNWRPHLMYLIMFILAFNGVAVPLIEAFTDVRLPLLEVWQSIPEPMWNLLMIGVGGYIVGRSAEKGIRIWKEKE